MTNHKQKKQNDSAKNIIKELADNQAFGSIKSITCNCAKTSPGYILKIIFYVELEEDAIPDVVKVRCANASEASECMRMIIQNHRVLNASDKQMMDDWDYLVTDFEGDPEKGISLYRPSS